MSGTLVCPHCKEHSEANITGDGWFQLVCDRCEKGFESLLATVRAKKSRGDRARGKRHFSIRVRHHAGEELIEFDQMGFDDFELRAGDQVFLSYVDSTVIIIENWTIGLYRVANNLTDDFNLKERIVGLLFLGAILFLLARCVAG